MEESCSNWSGVLKRASALRRRYENLKDGPDCSWSLVNRAAIRFKEGGIPDANDEDHVYALWTRAMYSVLNDLHRRQRTKQNALGPQVELPESVTDEPSSDSLELPVGLQKLAESQEALAQIDEEKALIVAMRYFDEMTWESIATALDTPISTVRRKWKVALTWLRADVKRRGFVLDTG